MQPGPEGRHTRRVARSSGAGKFALALVFVLLAAVLLLYLQTGARVVKVEPAAEANENPFAGLPPEPPPEKQAKTKGQLQKEAQEAQARAERDAER